MQGKGDAQVFAIAQNGVDPKRVPYRTLHTGAKIPAIGLGTFASDRYTEEQVAAAVRGAIDIGYRHIDCASVYGNERRVGMALQDAMRAGLPRETLWITSKLWNDKHGESDVVPACEQSLTDLQLDYLDLYLVHWPIKGKRKETWWALEKLYADKRVKAIGVANYLIPFLDFYFKNTMTF